MPAVLVTVPTVTQNLLHPLSTSSITARHLLDLMVQGKITEAEALIIHLDATASGLSVPHLHHPYFTPSALSAQPSQFILDWENHRIMLAYIPSGLVFENIKSYIKTL